MVGKIMPSQILHYIQKKRQKRNRKLIGYSNSLLLDILLYFSLSLSFLRLHLQHMEVTRLGVELELQLRPISQPQRHWIQAISVTYIPQLTAMPDP